MPAPLAYFLTWTTYGTWLLGDKRGYFRHHGPLTPSEFHEGNETLAQLSKDRLKSDPIILSLDDRKLIDECIRQTCSLSNWSIHALNVRSNHVHIVVTANDAGPDRVMDSLKAWGTRWLNRVHGRKPRWWTREGSKRYINDEDSLGKAIEYVLNQDKKGDA